MKLARTAPALIFDVEGTLVDCVEQTLASWHETLADFGLELSLKQLHRYSGMHGADMLDHLLRGHKARGSKDEILTEQGVRYREKFLRTGAAILRHPPAVRTHQGIGSADRSCDYLSTRRAQLLRLDPRGL